MRIAEELLRDLLLALGDPDYNLRENSGVNAVWDYRGVSLSLLQEARVAAGLAPVSEEISP